MKKLLLGTSALIGVAAAGPAFAQNAGGEPIKLSLGGHWLGAYTYTFNGGDSMVHQRRDDLQFDNVVEFKGNTKLDNGLTVGTVVQLRAENLPASGTATPGIQNGSKSEDRIKRQWVSFGGGFGEVRVGDQDDVRRQRNVDAPVPGGGTLFGANSPQFTANPGGITNTTQAQLTSTSRVSRIAYLSPTIAGFSLAASYAPGGEKGGQEFENAPANAPSSCTQGQGCTNIVNNEWSLSGLYNGKFGDLSLAASVNASQGHRITNSALTTGNFNPLAVDGGFNIGWGPITVGAGYERLDNPGTPLANGANPIGGGHRQNDTWDVGAIYEVGPFGVGLDWTRGIYRNDTNANVGRRLDAVSLGTDYKVGPGISVGVALDYTHSAQDVATGNFNSLALLMATGLFF